MFMQLSFAHYFFVFVICFGFKFLLVVGELILNHQKSSYLFCALVKLGLTLSFFFVAMFFMGICVANFIHNLMI